MAELFRVYSQTLTLTRQVENLSRITVEKAKELEGTIQRLRTVEGQNKELLAKMIQMQESNAKAGQEISALRSAMELRVKQIEKTHAGKEKQMDAAVKGLMQDMHTCAAKELDQKISQEEKRVKVVEERLSKLENQAPQDMTGPDHHPKEIKEFRSVIQHEVKEMLQTHMPQEVRKIGEATRTQITQEVKQTLQQEIQRTVIDCMRKEDVKERGKVAQESMPLIQQEIKEMVRAHLTQEMRTVGETIKNSIAQELKQALQNKSYDLVGKEGVLAEKSRQGARQALEKKAVADSQEMDISPEKGDKEQGKKEKEKQENKEKEKQEEEQGTMLRDYQGSDPYPSHPFPRPVSTEVDTQIPSKDFLHPERRQMISEVAEGEEGDVRNTEETQGYPSIVVKGFPKEPDREDFREVMKLIGLEGVKERLLQVKTQPKGFILKALLHSREDVRRVIKNKHMLRAYPIFIQQDLYPYQWREVLKERAKEKGERKREVQLVVEENKARAQMKNAPRTEHFDKIFQEIDKEGNGRRYDGRQSGNGGRGAGRGGWSYKGKDRRQRPTNPQKFHKETSTPWRTV